MDIQYEGIVSGGKILVQDFKFKRIYVFIEAICLPHSVFHSRYRYDYDLSQMLHENALRQLHGNTVKVKITPIVNGMQLEPKERSKTSFRRSLYEFPGNVNLTEISVLDCTKRTAAEIGENYTLQGSGAYNYSDELFETEPNKYKEWLACLYWESESSFDDIQFVIETENIETVNLTMKGAGYAY